MRLVLIVLKSEYVAQIPKVLLLIVFNCTNPMLESKVLVAPEVQYWAWDLPNPSRIIKIEAEVRVNQSKTFVEVVDSLGIFFILYDQSQR